MLCYLLLAGIWFFKYVLSLLRDTLIFLASESDYFLDYRKNRVWREELRVTGRFFSTLWSVAGCTRFSVRSLRTRYKHLCQFCQECSSLFCFLLVAGVCLKRWECWCSVFSCFVLMQHPRGFNCDFFLNTDLNNWESLDRIRSRSGVWIGCTIFERRVHGTL